MFLYEKCLGTSILQFVKRRITYQEGLKKKFAFRMQGSDAQWSIKRSTNSEYSSDISIEHSFLLSAVQYKKGLKLEHSVFHQTQGSDAEQLDRTSNRVSDVLHNWFGCLTGPTTGFLTVSFLTIEGAFGA